MPAEGKGKASGGGFRPPSMSGTPGELWREEKRTQTSTEGRQHGAGNRDHRPARVPARSMRPCPDTRTSTSPIREIASRPRPRRRRCGSMTPRAPIPNPDSDRSRRRPEANPRALARAPPQPRAGSTRAVKPEGQRRRVPPEKLVPGLPGPARRARRRPKALVTQYEFALRRRHHRGDGLRGAPREPRPRRGSPKRRNR